MTDRFKYSEVRQKIIEAIRTDLVGPVDANEVLEGNPRYEYIVGMLQADEEDRKSSAAGEQEIDTDPAYSTYDNDDNYTAGEDDDNEPVSTTHFQLPSSMGISFYVESSLPGFILTVRWGDYTESSEEVLNKEGKKSEKKKYTRIPVEEAVEIDLSGSGRTKEYELKADSNVCIHVSRIPMENGYSLVTAYVVNKRKNPADSAEGIMFQVELEAASKDGTAIFIAENKCRNVLKKDEFFYEQRPIMGRGRGCAAVWDNPVEGRCRQIKSAFIPEYEFPGVSPKLDGFDDGYFSTFTMSLPKKKEESLHKLNALADAYDKWINDVLKKYPQMTDEKFRDDIGNNVISKCERALKRIRNGIDLISSDDTAFDAFCFMNQVIYMQNGIRRYAKKHGKGVSCSFEDFVDPRNPENGFGWRPFQIAFILMNLKGIVHPEDPERGIVDLLYFPTGGGKTEAYLGLMAFTIANRRLRSDENDKFNCDGGVTIILRYTLRLLTTQQRDRITRMVIAAEMIRQKTFPKYGREPISIGFWVGGQVTPNKFEEFVKKADAPSADRQARNKVFKQILTCPFCGRTLSEGDFEFNIEKKSVEIFCPDPNCEYYIYKDNRHSLPVYLVDEEIYAKCPTIILSTVDKFARLPWDPNTNALFGRVDRKCSRDGYIAVGVEHKKHRAVNGLPASQITEIKPFMPPELIIQDELHLITGPLGTIYGAYETLIEKMCTHDGIKPKYVVSTATIKNAGAQSKALYARKETSQFPPDGFEIGDSFFIKEIHVETDPFRKYVGICAPGQSVKTALLRTYSIILQTAFMLKEDPEYKNYIDPYYTLIGYFNSIRELGGAVRLIQDDIPKRINRLKKKYGASKQRFLNTVNNVEITSRMSSYKIPEKLEQLETTCDSSKCLDTAVATNMIAVGMDVDRLGLMVVSGQPKQNSEYIQATSRIGRKYPGLVVTLYNAYRPRDLSHYENFTGYHSQMYRFVEGTTATPFSERARDRVLHALIIAAVRLSFPEMAENAAANNIESLTDDQITAVKKIIIDRLDIVKPSARMDAENEIDDFIDWWKGRAGEDKPVRYYVVKKDKYNSLMSPYDKPHGESSRPTLQSMREVESASQMYYYTED